MKKILAITAGLVLIGAGCGNSSSTESNQQTLNPNTPANSNQTVVQTPAPEQSASTPAPTGTVPPPSNSLPVYTLAQVASNNTPAKCWTAVNGTVYDVTTYAPKHPGGKEKVYEICGKDGTKEFNGMHGMSDKAKAAMEKLKIGTLN